MEYLSQRPLDVFFAEDNFQVGKLLLGHLRQRNLTFEWYQDRQNAFTRLQTLPRPQESNGRLLVEPVRFWVLDANLGPSKHQGEDGNKMLDIILERQLGGILINYSNESTLDTYGPRAHYFHPNGDIQYKDIFQVIDIIDVESAA